MTQGAWWEIIYMKKCSCKNVSVEKMACKNLSNFLFFGNMSGEKIPAKTV
jgi:hypothetical protein